MRTFFGDVGSAVTGLRVGVTVGDVSDEEGKEVVRTKASFSLVYPTGLAVGIGIRTLRDAWVGEAEVEGTKVGSDVENSYITGLRVGVAVLALSKSKLLEVLL
jgi:hypothetical protein